MTANPFSLNGRVALVSGASRGIGRALAAGLANAGATVLGISRTAATTDAPPGVSLRSCDVTDAVAFRAVCEDIMKRSKRLDAYVHCAGVSYSETDVPDSRERFVRTINHNLVAAYDCNRIAAEFMARGDGGSIINVTSIGAVLGFPGNPGYVASKGGLQAMTRALALDFASQRIRVNNLVPGYVRTAMTEASYADPTRNREREQRTMLGRWGTPEDLVGPAVFLASNASAYVTGQDIVVDGGWTAKGL